MSLNTSSKSRIPTGSSQRPALQGFRVWLQFAPQADAHDQRTLADHLLRFLAEQGFEHDGTLRELLIWSEARALTLHDQVELLLWLVAQCHAAAVEVGPLQLRADEGGQPLPTLRAVGRDLDLLPITWLFRRGRVSAFQVAEMLGGFCLSDTLH